MCIRDSARGRWHPIVAAARTVRARKSRSPKSFHAIGRRPAQAAVPRSPRWHRRCCCSYRRQARAWRADEPVSLFWSLWSIPCACASMYVCIAPDIFARGARCVSGHPNEFGCVTVVPPGSTVGYRSVGIVATAGGREPHVHATETEERRACSVEDQPERGNTARGTPRVLPRPDGLPELAPQ